MPYSVIQVSKLMTHNVSQVFQYDAKLPTHARHIYVPIWITVPAKYLNTVSNHASHI